MLPIINPKPLYERDCLFHVFETEVVEGKFTRTERVRCKNCGKILHLKYVGKRNPLDNVRILW